MLYIMYLTHINSIIIFLVVLKSINKLRLPIPSAFYCIFL